jgi:hypothetical protein
MKSAALRLVHTPPSGGGSFNRSFNFAKISGFSTEAERPLLRRRSPSDSGPEAL